MRLLLLLFSPFVLTVGSSGSAQVGALQTDCRLGGPIGKKGYQFVVTCAGRSRSPDGRYSIVQRAYTDKQPPIELQDSRRRTIAKLLAISDDMPFSVFWSPRGKWFLVNHHVGSFLDKPEVYEITSHGIVRHGGITREGGRMAARISPCLRTPKWDWVTGSAYGWSRDGRKIAWVFLTRPDACMGPKETGPVPPNKQWKTFWMISDADTGAIVPGSVRIVRNDVREIDLPADRIYSQFR